MLEKFKQNYSFFGGINMAKGKSFMDKVAKSGQDTTIHCPECGESISMIKLVSSERSEKTGAYRFKQKFIGMCKCNENDLSST